MSQFLFPALIGVGLFALGWWQRRKYRASLAWPSVSGRIVAAAVTAQTSPGDQDSADTTNFYPAVEYEYQVGQATLRGRTIALEERGYSNRKQAEAALAAFPAGGAVEVFYNPHNPSDAVLQRKASSGMVLMSIGGLIAVLGLLAAFTR